MTAPLPPVRPVTGPTTGPGVFPAAQRITVADSLCGHLPGEAHDGACDYWRGVALGEYPAPDAYWQPVTLPLHCPGLAPLTDPALRGWEPPTLDDLGLTADPVAQVLTLRAQIDALTAGMTDQQRADLAQYEPARHLRSVA